MNQIIKSIPYLSFVVYYCLFLYSKIYQDQKYEDKLIVLDIQKGWILEKVCKVLLNNYDGRAGRHTSLKKIPFAKKYFFPNYRAFLYAALYNPHILKSKNYIYFTHYDEAGGFVSEREIGLILNLATKVFVMNQASMDMLVKKHMSKSKLKVIYAGVDTELFNPPAKKIQSNTVGFCLRYKDIETYNSRKNYGLIIDVIKKLHFANVILIGRGWNNFIRFNEIKDLPNFNYSDVDYAEYPKLFRDMNVFVSLSSLEGGPIPMLEAMACNVFPVMMDTGFAPDLIEQNETGILLNDNFTVEKIVNEINRGCKLSQTKDVTKKVKSLTWKNFAREIITEFK